MEGDVLDSALSSRTRAWGAYATATWTPRSDVDVTLSGRRDRTRLEMTDTGPTAPDLDGAHSFTEFNPTASLVYRASDELTLYGNAGRGSRAPTPIELGCADPLRELRQDAAARLRGERVESRRAVGVVRGIRPARRDLSILGLHRFAEQQRAGALAALLAGRRRRATRC